MVKIGEREFTLILCIQVKKLYRLWIYDGSKSFMVAAKDITDATFLVGKQRETLMKSRVEVIAIVHGCG